VEKVKKFSTKLSESEKFFYVHFRAILGFTDNDNFVCVKVKEFWNWKHQLHANIF